MKRPQSAKKNSGSGEVRYFELADKKSEKFWEISITKPTVVVRYGKIGSDGTSTEKEFEDMEAAQKHLEKMVKAKTSKGYSEA